MTWNWKTWTLFLHGMVVSARPQLSPPSGFFLRNQEPPSDEDSFSSQEIPKGSGRSCRTTGLLPWTWYQSIPSNSASVLIFVPLIVLYLKCPGFPRWHPPESKDTRLIGEDLVSGKLPKTCFQNLNAIEILVRTVTYVIVTELHSTWFYKVSQIIWCRVMKTR